MDRGEAQCRECASKGACPATMHIFSQGTRCCGRASERDAGESGWTRQNVVTISGVFSPGKIESGNDAGPDRLVIRRMRRSTTHLICTLPASRFHLPTSYISSTYSHSDRRLILYELLHHARLKRELECGLATSKTTRPHDTLIPTNSSHPCGHASLSYRCTAYRPRPAIWPVPARKWAATSQCNLPPPSDDLEIKCFSLLKN